MSSKIQNTRSEIQKILEIQQHKRYKKWCTQEMQWRTAADVRPAAKKRSLTHHCSSHPSKIFFVFFLFSFSFLFLFFFVFFSYSFLLFFWPTIAPAIQVRSFYLFIFFLVFFSGPPFLQPFKKDLKKFWNKVIFSILQDAWVSHADDHADPGHLAL